MRSQGDQRGHGSPKFLAHVVVLCFEWQCPQPNAVARLNSIYFSPLKFKAGYAINVGASKFWEVQRIFARISPNLPENLFCNFCLQNFSHKDHENLFFGVTSIKGLHLLFCKRWVSFLPGLSGTLPRYLGIFFWIFRDFAQIFDKSKLLGMRLNPLHPRPLHYWATLLLIKRDDLVKFEPGRTAKY